MSKRKAKKAAKKAAKKIIKTDDLPNISFGEAIRAIAKGKKS
ncbi:hypothetical protein [Ferruginibacter sp.]